MPKQQTDHLISLIKTLTKAEKRFFRLFVNRNQASGDILFLHLFDLLDKQKKYDERLILERIPAIKKRQLSNLKAHLYKQLLLCLRLVHRNHNIDIELREGVDYARVLYNKGLYRQSLEILDRTKSKAREHKLNLLTLEIIEFEKLIESQYITRSMSTRAEELTGESDELSKQISQAHQFSNLALQLYSLYLKVGYVRNQSEYLFVREFFNNTLPKYEISELGFYEKLYLYQSQCWYYYMTQDFLNYYRYAQKWVDIFEDEPSAINLEPPLYLKALHNLLTALFLLWDYRRFSRALDQLAHFPDKFSGQQVTNVKGLHDLFLSIHRINRHYMEGTFEKGLSMVPDILQKIKQDIYKWDTHRKMVFYYKIACLYFGSGDNKNAIHYLNLIINQGYSDIREDIQCFARILCLIAHFELGNDLLIEYQVKSVYRFLSKREDMHQVQREILKFIRRLSRINRSDLPKAFVRLRNSLEKIRSEPFEQRPFLYLDIISWLESKIEGCTVQEIVQRKFQKDKKPLEID